MKPTLALFGAACALPPVLVHLSVDTIAFSPAEGAEVTKTFTTVAEFALEGVEIEVDDDVDEAPDIDLAASFTRTIVVEDAYGPTADGRPASLTRTFETVAQETQYEITVDGDQVEHDEDAKETGSGALSGATVVFTWDEDDEAHTKEAAEDEDIDAELLEGLEEDMDLRALLPDGEVSEGDSWDVEGTALVALLDPGGDPTWSWEGETEDRGVEIPAVGLDPRIAARTSLFIGEVDESSCSAKFAGVRDEDGTRVGVIELEVELTTTTDVSEWMAGEVAHLAEMGLEIEFEQADVTLVLEGEGELLWDLDHGHVHALTLTGDATVTLDRQIVATVGGAEEVGVSTTIELAGTIRHSLQVER